MKIFKKLFIILVLFIWLLSTTNADIIPENSHRYSKCVKIENPDAISWYQLVIQINTVVGDDEVYVVQKDSCLRHHYHFWTSTPYLVKQEIDIQAINNTFKNRLSSEYDWIDLTDLENNFWDDFIKLEPISVNWWYISNRSKKTYENITYKLIQENNEYKLLIVQKESDETWVAKIEYFEDGLESLPTQTDDLNIEKSYFIQFLQSRLLTIILETIILFFLCKLFFKKENIKNKKIILAWILASTITLPILRFVLPYFFQNWTAYTIFGEIFVSILEIIIIKYLLNIKWTNAIIASIVCNLFSVIIGLLL